MERNEVINELVRKYDKKKKTIELMIDYSIYNGYNLYESKNLVEEYIRLMQ